jgi:tRNA nucleotidyltransferase (CCA-adding enzyme)
VSHAVDLNLVARRVAESRSLTAAAPHFDLPVSVVGGFVRDALLDRPHGSDIDLVVEGDAIAVARAVGRVLGAMVVPYEQFGTATLELPHGGEMDFVTARRESYSRPGALPRVESGTLADDLARRDISVNAMAYRLSGPNAGELVDPHGGHADLREGLVRVLRDDAFLEDPSRVVRAARYAARLGFRLDARTARLAAEAASSVDLRSARVADEFARLLREDAATAERGIALLADAGVAWCKALPTTPFVALDAALAHPHAPPLPAWTLRAGFCVPPGDLRAAALPGWARGLAEEAANGDTLARRLQSMDATPSTIDAVLGAAKPATVCAALAAGADVVAIWWERWNPLVLDIRGTDMVAAGVAPGPAIGRGLRAARAAVLDERARTRDEQLQVALEAAG